MRGHAKQLSSTDSKIKNIAKTAFQKIYEFFAHIKSNCKSAYAVLKAKYVALKARITSFFKKSDSLSQPSQISRQTSLDYGIQAPPSTPVRSRSSSLDNDSLDNEQPAQVSVRESTPQTLALIPYQPNPFLQAHNAAMQEIYNRSLRSLVDNNYELPSPAENLLNTLHSFTLLPANASQPEIPVATGAPVNPEQVLASAISFAQRQNRPNTSPGANVDQFSQLTQQQKLEISEQLTVNNPHLPAGGQTTQSSGAKAAMMFAAGAGVLAGTAVLKNDPKFLTKLASETFQFVQPVLASAATATRIGAQIVADGAQRGAQIFADGLKSVAANA
jgi:hypothetical protein